MISPQKHRIAVLGILSALLLAACANADRASNLKEIQRAQAGMLDLVLLSDTGALKQGKDSFVLEFRNRADQRLVDVRAVKVNATMPMAGMAPMIGNTAITPSGTAGRYEVATDLTMAGSWRIGLEWDGPAGKGTASLQGRVQ